MLFSYDMLVSRSRTLPPEYIPRELVPAAFPFAAALNDPKRLMEPEAAKNAALLFAHCTQAHGMALYGISAYRSYQRQAVLYGRNPESLYVAPPGASEHQTGLALDLSCPSAGMELTDRFASSPEGRCLLQHAPLYGFILRYPKGKENITGYPWEPWHIRYVTKSLAIYLDTAGLTLEEYHALSAVQDASTAPSAVP
ncbi:MAG TPA: M15 family metallopeptidase [Candidatus Limivivens intestinipullorum]|uniref:M15 family metallopeptidase n=1 Tax=Candidatus Limivivens intestinipullorum TaxID=2840858 RepID=A0A9D1EQL6_9FIRM|nr:M15 family metallopeptidase [Candidatus Limivivens intestinipullorum]